jgi:hypothetical protein
VNGNGDLSALTPLFVRTTTMMAKRLLLLALAIGALNAGCAATSDYMRPVTGPEPTGAPPNKARVVFVRPSGGASEAVFMHGGARRVVFTIIDERGAFLGDSTEGCRFSVYLDPGDHYFIAWSETTETVKATLAPGRTYYVEVRWKMGWWKPNGTLWAVNRKSNLMKYIPSYLSDTTVTTSDFAAGQAHLNSLGNEVTKAARKGLDTYNGYSPDEKADATLLPDDGQ